MASSLTLTNCLRFQATSSEKYCGAPFDRVTALVLGTLALVMMAVGLHIMTAGIGTISSGIGGFFLISSGVGSMGISLVLLFKSI